MRMLCASPKSLNLAINGALKYSGISKIQTMRKDAGFEVMDHIAVTYEADEKLSNVFEKFGDEIKTEVLAVSIKSGELKGYEKDWKINGEAVKLAVEKQ